MWLVACVSEPSDSSDAAEPAAAVPPTEIGGDRPAAVVAPSGYDPARSWPVVVLLHGYGANSTLQDVIFGLAARVDTLGFVLVKPEGTVDDVGAQFWNATPECCNFGGIDVDDSAYLIGLVDELDAFIDISSVSFVGHSNGGYMSYRMACDHGARIDRIAVLAGATFFDEADCLSPEPVGLLHMHGTEDDAVLYESTAAHAGAVESAGRFAAKAGCAGPTPGAARDDLGAETGAETTVDTWSGCAPGIDVQLWSAVGGDHFYLSVDDGFRDDVASWLAITTD